jgi:hypothetical protein
MLQEMTAQPDCEIVLADNGRRLLCYQFVLARHSPVLRTNIDSAFVERDAANNNVIIRAVNQLNIPRQTTNVAKDLRRSIRVS